MMQVQVLVAALRSVFTLLRGRDDGASVVETVILAAIFAAMALAVAGIIYSKVTAKANSIPMN
jgi:Flp pilus assembly protein TadG